MPEGFEYDVFLSHSRRDKTAALDLAKRLSADGLRVRAQQWSIEPLPQSANQALQSSRSLVLLLSQAASESEWASIESDTLLFRDASNTGRCFVPVRLDDAEVGDAIRQFAYIDWRRPSNGEYAKLLAACQPPTPPAPTALVSDARRLPGHEGIIFGVTTAGDGRWIASASQDKTVRLWDVQSGECLKVLRGHMGEVNCVAATPEGRIVSCSDDSTVRVWDLDSGRPIVECKTQSAPRGQAVTPDGRVALACCYDGVVRMYDLTSGRLLRPLEGHTDTVSCGAVTPDALWGISGSNDNTLRVWELATGKCLGVLAGHVAKVTGVAVTPDGKYAASASWDKTVRLWDLRALTSVAVLEGHTGFVISVAVAPDGERLVSGGTDGTIRVWRIATGLCELVLENIGETLWSLAVSPDGQTVISGSENGMVRLWPLPPVSRAVPAQEPTRYTNAKVVLVGESGVGKTGLAIRLAEGRWEVTESTHGMRVSQLHLGEMASAPGVEREVWLWDFAGQPDYRLVHQLSMDDAALALLIFDPQDDNPFEILGYWDKAIGAVSEHQPAKLLVAGRSDRGGITVSRRKLEAYRTAGGYAEFLATSAKTGDGCSDLREAIARHIPWERLPWIATTRLFKALKDAILELKAESTSTEEGTALVRLAELRQRLQLMRPEEVFTEQELRAVVGLLEGQGLVEVLDFGEFVLLQPERLNAYASAVVRAAREHSDEMGAVRELDVLEGRIDFKDMPRLRPHDEKILLRAMTQSFLDRALCLRQETPEGEMLVFPSYFNRDRPTLPHHPNIVVTYYFAGPLDEVYATLVVRLSYTEPLEVDELWKDAADFRTVEGRRVGLTMARRGEGAAEIAVYFEPQVPADTQVAFVKYVHEHLLKRATDVTRLRSYVCPHCGEPVESTKAVQKRLAQGLQNIPCVYCGASIPLLDLLEQKLTSVSALRRVQEMDAQASNRLDNQSLEMILVGHSTAIVAEAGQIFRPTVVADWGIDGEIEFKDDHGQASGRRVYVQLKSGDSYLRRRKRDAKEIFTIKDPRHAEYWQAQAYPVMLVVRTSDGSIRWMNVTDYLRQHGTSTKQIEFEGEPFTALNVARLRDRVLSGR